MDKLSFMFFYYDRACGVPQIGAIASQRVFSDDLGDWYDVGIILNQDIEYNVDILDQTMVNRTKWAFAGGIPQSLLN